MNESASNRHGPKLGLIDAVGIPRDFKKRLPGDLWESSRIPAKGLLGVLFFFKLHPSFLVAPSIPSPDFWRPRDP